LTTADESRSAARSALIPAQAREHPRERLLPGRERQRRRLDERVERVAGREGVTLADTGTRRPRPR